MFNHMISEVCLKMRVPSEGPGRHNICLEFIIIKAKRHPWETIFLCSFFLGVGEVGSHYLDMIGFLKLTFSCSV